jgi:hypothetical protein
VIDAYTGDTGYYLVDKEDPVAATMDKIYPQLFRAAEDMPEGVFEHIRYPANMLNIQANIYKRYHVKNVTVFYQGEDNWDIAKEKVGAKIETTHVTIKEELEVPADEVVEEVVEAPEAEVKEEKAAEAEAPKSEEKSEVKVEESAKEETKAEPEAEDLKKATNDVAKVEEVPEEEPSVKTETPVVQEVVDTVSEEKVEEVKDEEAKKKSE